MGTIYCELGNSSKCVTTMNFCRLSILRVGTNACTLDCGTVPFWLFLTKTNMWQYRPIYAMCNMQYSICNMCQYAIWNMQNPICKISYAMCGNMWHSVWLLKAACPGLGSVCADFPHRLVHIWDRLGHNRSALSWSSFNFLVAKTGEKTYAHGTHNSPIQVR